MTAVIRVKSFADQKSTFAPLMVSAATSLERDEPWHTDNGNIWSWYKYKDFLNFPFPNATQIIEVMKWKSVGSDDIAIGLEKATCWNPALWFSKFVDRIIEAEYSLIGGTLYLS